MPSLPNPIKIATKGAELGLQIGSFVAGQAFQRVQSLVGGDSNGNDATYSPVQPPARDDKPQERSPQPPKLEAVKSPGETSTGSKPTTSSTTATGPGGTARMAPKAPAKKSSGAGSRAKSGGTSTTSRAKTGAGGGGATDASVGGGGASGKEITANPATRATKGETSTTVKATSRTGARSAGGRISSPKAASKARKRSAGASAKTGAGAGTGQKPGAPTAAARTGDLSKARGKGGRPATVKAENSPAELAASKTGKQAAPLGGDDKS